MYNCLVSTLTTKTKYKIKKYKMKMKKNNRSDKIVCKKLR